MPMSDDERRRRNRERMRERYHSDPEYREQQKKLATERKLQRYQASPRFQEQQRAYGRNRYAQKKDDAHYDYVMEQLEREEQEWIARGRPPLSQGNVDGERGLQAEPAPAADAIPPKAKPARKSTPPKRRT